MSKRIQCYTLFDITKTGVRQRSKIPENMQTESFIVQRNTQVNLDTILQVIGLRSQPEAISDPLKKTIDINTESNRFGFFYKIGVEKTFVWSFQFNVQHESVFDDGYDVFGHLYNDCHNIPMIKSNNTHEKLINLLDTSPEFCNIYFEFV